MMIDRDEYLKEKYIAFVDVLGFSDMVNNFTFNEYYDFNFNGTQQDTFHVVNEYYHKVLNELTLEQKSELEITTISDCIIISSRTLEPLLTFLFFLQSNMIYNDAANVKIVMRGYVTKGKFVHNQEKNLIVGEAYQRAFIGEKCTEFPRIELDQAIVNEIHPPYNILIKIDENDSKRYINYLIREKFHDMCCRNSIDDFINDMIEKYENNEKVQQKYIWLRNYHEEIKKYKPTEDEHNIWKFLFPPNVN